MRNFYLIPVTHVDAPDRLLLAKTLVLHLLGDQSGDAAARTACAVEEELMLGDLPAGDSRRRDETGDGDTRRTLDIVIERAVAKLILVEQAKRVEIGKVLKLHQTIVAEPANTKTAPVVGNVIATTFFYFPRGCSFWRKLFTYGDLQVEGFNVNKKLDFRIFRQGADPTPPPLASP